MDNNDKLALRESTTAIKCKLIIKATDALPQIILTESNCIKDWTYTDDRYVPQQGFIGQFVARTLSGNLQNIDDNFNIENREVELQIGIVNRDKNTENWYSMGNFLITNPEDDEVRDNTKFEAMDYAKLFNKTFDGDYTDNVFTVSYNTKMENKETVDALWLAKYTCAQVNVELGSTVFTNSDYEIDINPFRNNEPCRDVMKEISKLAYSWVRIGWDNKCYIDFGVKQESSVNQYDIFTNDHYYTLETKKEVYGPVNKVVVGMSNIDGESHALPDNPSISTNGEHAIYIYDNPLTYTFEHRERANKKGNVLFGLTYSHIKCETIGFPWLIGNELISISNMEGNKKYTYPFNKTITYTGHIKSTIDSMGESAIEETLSYESDVVRNARNALINVNKQEGTIQILSERIENIPKEINPTGTASGSIIKLEDSSNNPLIDLEIEGKSEQEVTVQGTNLFNINGDVNQYYESYAMSGTNTVENGVLTTSANGTSSRGRGVKISVVEGDVIRFTAKLLSKGTGTLGILNIVTDTRTQRFVYVSEGAVNTNTYTVENGVSEVICSFITGEGEGAQFTDIIITKNDTDTSYKPFVPNSPSPDYPSEIESVGYENLFNYNNASDINNTSVTQYRIFEISGLEPNTRYIFHNYEQITDNSNIYVYLWKQTTYNGNTISLPIFNPSTYNSSVRYSANDSGKMYLAITPTDEATWQSVITHFEKAQLEKGTKVHSYIPFGKYGIEVKANGNQLFNKNNIVEGYLSTRGVLQPDENYFSTSDYIDVSEFDKITLSGSSDTTGSPARFILYDIDKNVIDYYSLYNRTINVSSASYIRFSGFKSDIDTIKLEPGNLATEYEPYQSNTSLIILNEPLRSLPNGTKDLLYIKNNHSYVDRYVGGVILDGSESWGLYAECSNENFKTFSLKVANGKSTKPIKCSHFIVKKGSYSQFLGIEECCYSGAHTGTLGIYISIESEIASTVDEFKNWLSLNNTEVIYELAETYTEELGEIQIPSTYKGTTYIQTTDKLEPNLNITYVRDTVIGDYVENHVAGIRITEDEIKSSVESISTSVNGLNSTVKRVEEITTDSSKTINIISKNIITEGDNAGDVTEVTTTTGFTFNKDGMTINDGSGFKAEHRAEGTYYKDGTSTVGQYTKDGSKQKDLQLFGVYSYGMKDIDDTPMFIGQLYEDENGEECFGHFVNI